MNSIGELMVVLRVMMILVKLLKLNVGFGEYSWVLCELISVIWSVGMLVLGRSVVFGGGGVVLGGWVFGVLGVVFGLGVVLGLVLGVGMVLGVSVLLLR